MKQPLLESIYEDTADSCVAISIMRAWDWERNFLRRTLEECFKVLDKEQEYTASALLKEHFEVD